jgi:hypothetical protein
MIPTKPKALGTFAAFPLGGGPMGKVTVTDDEVALELAPSAKRFKRMFIEKLENEGELAMSKVQVALGFYDLQGDRGSVSFGMRENEYRVLKQLLGK